MYTYVYTYIYVYVYMYICIYVYVYICIYEFLYMKHIWVYIHIFVYVYTWVQKEKAHRIGAQERSNRRTQLPVIHFEKTQLDITVECV